MDCAGLGMRTWFLGPSGLGVLLLGRTCAHKSAVLMASIVAEECDEGTTIYLCRCRNSCGVETITISIIAAATVRLQ